MVLSQDVDHDMIWYDSGIWRIVTTPLSLPKSLAKRALVAPTLTGTGTDSLATEPPVSSRNSGLRHKAADVVYRCGRHALAWQCIPAPTTPMGRAKKILRTDSWTREPKNWEGSLLPMVGCGA